MKSCNIAPGKFTCPGKRPRITAPASQDRHKPLYSGGSGNDSLTLSPAAVSSLNGSPELPVHRNPQEAFNPEYYGP